VGGKVRVVMRKPDGTEVATHGEYMLIDRAHRLVMTWTFDDPSNEQLIELSLSARCLDELENADGLVTVPSSSGQNPVVPGRKRRCPLPGQGSLRGQRNDRCL
jgi:uncharacterized protein YndB with AHSA1/START domain